MSDNTLRANERLVQDFLADCKLRGMSPESIRRYRSSAGLFLGYLKTKDIGLTEVNRDILRGFIYHLREERKNSQKTIENDFSALSSLYDYLVYEEITSNNPILPVRKRYLRRYKKEDNHSNERQCLSVEEMTNLIASIPNSRDKAMMLLLAKTGIRRGELIRIDVDDINWEDQSILLKPARKRSNRLVYFDDECLRVLRRWLDVQQRLKSNTKALFLNERGGRLNRNGIYTAITKWAKMAGYHDPKSPKIEEHFSPHCFRHWFTTHLRRNGMRREYVQELRGDVRDGAIDIYDHIDREDLKRCYLACMPVLGV